MSGGEGRGRGEGDVKDLPLTYSGYEVGQNGWEVKRGVVRAGKSTEVSRGEMLIVIEERTHSVRGLTVSRERGTRKVQDVETCGGTRDGM